MKSLYEITGNITDFNQVIVPRNLIDRMQAKIDALMLEFCPEEMTSDQLDTWGKHQARSPEVQIK